jgi:AraC-like DNA-binding protein
MILSTGVIISRDTTLEKLSGVKRCCLLLQPGKSRRPSPDLTPRLRPMESGEVQTAVLDPARSVADIAATVGFSDQAHMTTTFSRLLGYTPGHWRRERLS